MNPIFALVVTATATAPIAEINLRVAIVGDPELSFVDRALVDKALAVASETFADRFGVRSPSFRIDGEVDQGAFLDRYVHPNSARCRVLMSARYRGSGSAEFRPYRAEALRFLSRWPLDSFSTFFTSAEKPKTYDGLLDEVAARYVVTVDHLRKEKTPAKTPLVEPDKSFYRSFAAWSCALAEQTDYDVIITNAFILADVLSEPHVHAFLGRAKVGGVAGPNPSRRMLGEQVLLASTFGIDTNIPWLSELGTNPATAEERANIVGAYLLAHEIGHAIFGIPDFFDHPPSCLMTSRPNETYREGLDVLKAHPGTCPKCRPWVEARSFMDRGRFALEAGQNQEALRLLTNAANKTPTQMHGGRGKRLAEISVLMSRAYLALGRMSVARQLAKRAVDLDPNSTMVRQNLVAIPDPKEED